MIKILKKKEEILFDDAKIDKINKELRIDKTIKEIENISKSFSKLPYREKRNYALKEINKKNVNIKEYLDLQNSTIILFNVDKIREERENYIEKKISEIKDEKMTIDEKRFKVLEDLNTSISYEYIEKKEEPKPKKEKEKEYYYNYKDERGKFWINNKYYDISTDEKDIKKELGKINITDEKNEQYLAFLYDNKLKTYNLALSKSFSEIFGDYSIPTIKTDNEHFNEEYGFCFCGKEIKELNKKCLPNEMMCKECMKDNLEMYGLNKLENINHILININGRISINNFNDGKYRCAGKFKYGREIKNCLPGEFSCKACKLLDEYKNYYGNN